MPFFGKGFGQLVQDICYGAVPGLIAGAVCGGLVVREIYKPNKEKSGKTKNLEDITNNQFN